VLKADVDRRHLAEEWDNTFLPPTHALAQRRLHPNPTVLHTIDTLVLLDLLGNAHARIYSFFRETDWLHAAMSSADERLRNAGLVEVERGEEGWFPAAKLGKGMIGDDHVPVSPFRCSRTMSSRQFLHRGVNILHVISNPFPQVWHTLAVGPASRRRKLGGVILMAGRRVGTVYTCHATVEPDIEGLYRRVSGFGARDGRGEEEHIKRRTSE